MIAKWHGAPFRDYQNKKWLVTFETEDIPAIYDKTRDSELNVDISEHRKKRSNDANNYFYKLISLISKATGVNTTDIHDRILADNLNFIYENGAIEWTVKDWEANKYRLYKYKDEYWYDSFMVVKLAKPDGTFYTIDGKPKTSKIYWHIKGSHQMDTKEMSQLIDDTVNEAKGLGIETLPPDEIERIKKLWKA